MNGKITKQIVAVSKNGFWRITCKGGRYSLEQKAIVGYVKVNECCHEETVQGWSKKFDIIQL